MESQTEAQPTYRVHGNRVVTTVLLLFALPAVAVTSWVSARLARRTAVSCIRLGARLCGVRVEVRGELPAVGCPTVCVANHSSPIDVVAVVLALPDVRFVAGADLFRVPLLRGAMKALRTVPVDRRSGGGSHLVLPAGDGLGPEPLLVFPEGGIAPRWRRLPFRRSAFAFAIEHRADVVPVAIHGAAACLPPRSRLGVRPGAVTVEFLGPLRTSGLKMEDRHLLCADAERGILDALGSADGGRAATGEPA